MSKPKRGHGSAARRGGSKGGEARARAGAWRGREAGATRAPGRPPTKTSAKTKGVGGEQVEGRQAVRELLLAGKRKVRELTVSGDDEGLQDLVDLALELRVTVTEVSDNALGADRSDLRPTGGGRAGRAARTGRTARPGR